MPRQSTAGALPPSGSSSARPTHASAIQAKSRRRRDVATATTSGPVNSTAIAIPSGTYARAE
ncbi:hypothetical protein ACEN88_32605 [Massilia sp. CT11-108]|uniref:hypothetical protein n=1 Tax=Massilia sp. CT11-108 TaxID=3393900 RepID=UPI0039A6B6A5